MISMFGRETGTRCPKCGGDTFYIHEDVVNTWKDGALIHIESNGSYGSAECAKCGYVDEA